MIKVTHSVENELVVSRCVDGAVRMLITDEDGDMTYAEIPGPPGNYKSYSIPDKLSLEEAIELFNK